MNKTWKIARNNNNNRIQLYLAARLALTRPEAKIRCEKAGERFLGPNEAPAPERRDSWPPARPATRASPPTPRAAHFRPRAARPTTMTLCLSSIFSLAQAARLSIAKETRARGPEKKSIRELRTSMRLFVCSAAADWPAFSIIFHDKLNRIELRATSLVV